jgi:hypothetical protein
VSSWLGAAFMYALLSVATIIVVNSGFFVFDSLKVNDHIAVSILKL